MSIKSILLSLTLIIGSLSPCFGQNSDEKTLLFFTAKWCPHCVTAKSDMQKNDKLSEATKDYTIIEIDYNKDKDVVEGHNVTSLPTFIIYQNGKEIGRMVGYTGPRQLTKFLK